MKQHMKQLHGLEGAMEELGGICYGQHRHRRDIKPALIWSLKAAGVLILICLVIILLPSNANARGFSAPLWWQLACVGVGIVVAIATSVANFREANRGACIQEKRRVGK